jgi:hypothetical protein
MGESYDFTFYLAGDETDLLKYNGCLIFYCLKAAAHSPPISPCCFNCATIEPISAFKSNRQFVGTDGLIKLLGKVCFKRFYPRRIAVAGKPLFMVFGLSYFRCSLGASRRAFQPSHTTEQCTAFCYCTAERLTLRVTLSLPSHFLFLYD